MENMVACILYFGGRSGAADAAVCINRECGSLRGRGHAAGPADWRMDRCRRWHETELVGDQDAIRRKVAGSSSTTDSQGLESPATVILLPQKRTRIC